MKRVFLLFVCLSSLFLFACSQHGLDHPTQKILSNGDKVVVIGNEVTIYNQNEKLLQQSTFTSPTFLEARSLLVEIQTDIKAKDFASLLENNISYPLRVNHQGKSREYRDSEELQAVFSKVFTKKIRQDIMQQAPYRLFANDQGVMIADGAVWFGPKGITTVNKM